MYRANQLWIVAEEDLKDMLTPMLTPGLTLRILPGRTMVLCESAEDVDKWARRVPDSAGFMDDYEPQYQPYMQQIYDCIVEKRSIPETYTVGKKEHKLQTLFCTNILCGGVEIAEASGIRNVVTFLPEDLHALNFLGCCSYDVDNFVVVYSPEVCGRADVHPYLQRERCRFFEFVRGHSDSWFYTVAPVVRGGIADVKWGAKLGKNPWSDPDYWGDLEA